MKNQFLFLTLNTFSATGGIEKVSRVAAKVFEQFSKEKDEKFTLYSLHDSGKEKTEPYISPENFKGFGAKRSSFVRSCLARGMRSRVVVISHINLALPAFLIKVISPKTKIVVITHGIEVWQPLSELKKRLLEKADVVVSVSRFTQQILQQNYRLKNSIVIPNCLDPYLPSPNDKESRLELRKNWGIGNSPLLMTLSRLSAKEQNKNYRKVIRAMAALKEQFPRLKYLFVGKYEQAEKKRMETLATELGIGGHIIFTGFVPDEELAAHYEAADLYVMPSTKEGFGISFIEAMYYGLPVISGNADGSSEALLQGKLGIMINPANQQEITDAIEKVLRDRSSYLPDRKVLLTNFGFETYGEKWKKVMSAE